MKNFISLILSKKKYWLVPLIVALALIALLLMLTEYSSIAPFTYAIY